MKYIHTWQNLPEREETSVRKTFHFVTAECLNSMFEKSVLFLFTLFVFCFAWIFSPFNVGILQWNKNSGIYFIFLSQINSHRDASCPAMTALVFVSVQWDRVQQVSSLPPPAQLDPLMLRSGVVGKLCDVVKTVLKTWNSSKVTFWRAHSTQNKNMMLVFTQVVPVLLKKIITI